MIDLADALLLMHPAIAVAFVFPLIGMTLNMAWQTRQRRLQTVEGSKSKIPPVVGPEHLKLGRTLAGAVVSICLLGIVHPSIKYIIKNDLWNKAQFQVISLALLLIATIASLVFLYQAKQRLWRGVFAILTGMGVVILGIQDIIFNRPGFPAIFRRDDEWFVSHFYSGMAATMLMIFSLAIIQDIYQDRSNRWRIVHTVLNSIAILLFLGQAMTGVRDLLEIPLGWQEPTVYGCDFKVKVCPPFK